MAKDCSTTNAAGTVVSVFEATLLGAGDAQWFPPGRRCCRCLTSQYGSYPETSHQETSQHVQSKMTHEHHIVLDEHPTLDVHHIVYPLYLPVEHHIVLDYSQGQCFSMGVPPGPSP